MMVHSFSLTPVDPAQLDDTDLANLKAAGAAGYATLSLYIGRAAMAVDIPMYSAFTAPGSSIDPTDGINVRSADFSAAMSSFAAALPGFVATL
jgi:hypothetical protein